MKNIGKKLQYSFRWITAEAIGYQGILLAHQLLLFKVSGFRLYGSIGALFSILYLMVNIISFGLESSLSPFFTEITKSKKQFASFFIYQCLLSLFITLGALSFFLIVKKMENNLLISSCNYWFIGIFTILIFLESIKKTLRGILYLSFKNKINASIEFFYILFYVSTVWLTYIVIGTITLYSIFIPMLISSLLSVFILFFFVYQCYKNFPKCHKDMNKKLQLRILTCRACNFVNQFAHNMFSSNFLVPFFAVQFGLEMAGVFKLLSHITYGITALIRKIFGWTSDAILAHTKHMTIGSKQAAFLSINQKLINILLGVSIFFACNMHKIIKYSQCSNTLLNWPLMIFFIIITMSENLFIPYEKFYIAEEKIYQIVLFNLFSIICLMTIINYYAHLSQLLILITIAFIRITLFVILSIISFYFWQIKPHIRLKPLYIIGYSLLALFFSIIL